MRQSSLDRAHTWHDPPYRSDTPSDRGALAGHRVILLAMLLRMLPNNLDGKRYVPLIVALMPWRACCL